MRNETTGKYSGSGEVPESFDLTKDLAARELIKMFQSRST